MKPRRTQYFSNMKNEHGYKQTPDGRHTIVWVVDFDKSTGLWYHERQLVNNKIGFVKSSTSDNCGTYYRTEEEARSCVDIRNREKNIP